MGAPPWGASMNVNFRDAMGSSTHAPGKPWLAGVTCTNHLQQKTAGWLSKLYRVGRGHCSSQTTSCCELSELAMISPWPVPSASGSSTLTNSTTMVAYVHHTQTLRRPTSSTTTLIKKCQPRPVVPTDHPTTTTTTTTKLSHQPSFTTKLYLPSGKWHLSWIP